MNVPKRVLAIYRDTKTGSKPGHFIGNVSWVSVHLGMDLHILLSPEEEASFRSIAGKAVLHTREHDWVESILEETALRVFHLIVAEESVEGRILETAPCPVLVLPTDLHLDEKPIRSFMVPLSGEERASSALQYALSLADKAHLPVDVVHAIPPGRQPDTDHLDPWQGDELPHEFHEFVDRHISEASPFSDPQERSRARHFFHYSAEAEAGIDSALNRTPGAALVLEWKGTLETGHAETLKHFLENPAHPVILVRTRKESRSRLKTGPDFEAA